MFLLSVKLRDLSLSLALVPPPPPPPPKAVNTILLSNGESVVGITCRGAGSAVNTVHSQRVLMESYGTSIPRQGVMHGGAEEGEMTEALV